MSNERCFKIKPIETQYKGYRFRSRLEARWAVFFDSLGMLWEYEREGFDLGEAGWYLPDFWLPALDKWIEIKPMEYDEEHDVKWPDDPRFYSFSEENSLVVIKGSPRLPFLASGVFDERRESYIGFWYWRGSGDYPYFWCECPTCGSIDIQYDGRSARNEHMPDCEILMLRKQGKSHPIYGRTDDKVYNLDSPRLRAAYDAACSIRF